MPGNTFCICSFSLRPSLEYLVSASWMGSLVEEKVWWALSIKELYSNWSRCGGRSCRIAKTGEMAGWGCHLPWLEIYLPLCICLKWSTSPLTHIHYLLIFPIQSSKLASSWKLSLTSPTWQITYLFAPPEPLWTWFVVFNFVLAVTWLFSFHEAILSSPSDCKLCHQLTDVCWTFPRWKYILYPWTDKNDHIP
jgi:hypothetical protein